MDLIAEPEGIQPQLRKKWAHILDAFSVLALQRHPYILASSGRLMVSIAIQHVSRHCIVPCLHALSTAYCKWHGIDCGCRMKWLKVLCTTVFPSRPPHLGPRHCIGRWLGCTQICKPRLHMLFV